MDFFGEQDAARRNSRWLVVLFVLAVATIVVSIYGVLIAILASADSSPGAAPLDLWQPDLFITVAGVISTVIFLASLFKVVALSSGGGAKVAESLDGRLVSRATDDRLEQRLLNVVDEMAIASGIPAPKVYVLDSEHGINAFAAGSSTSDAVVAVTRGTLEQLNRDELQGVVGHEFSHIFNGDMRLNIRLMGVLYGILMLALIGRLLLRGGSSSSKKEGGGIMLLGLALFVVGYVGVFFGRLIKAAVSRQREFLADASAVQFTRNPAGIAGALKKIAGIDSTQIQHPDAESASHMFFGNGIHNFLSLLATHPPVEERISRLDPYFEMELRTPASTHSMGSGQSEAAMGFSGGVNAGGGITTETVRASVGNVGVQHLDYAQALMQRLPEPIWKALREPQGARAVVLGLLLLKDSAAKNSLRTALPQLSAERVLQTLAVTALLKDVARADWLPLLELAIPALEELPEEELAAIPDEVDALINADKRVTLFEFSLATLLRHTLTERRPSSRHRHKGGLKQIQKDLGQLLSLMVHAGHDDEALAREAFVHALRVLESNGEVVMIERSQLSLKGVEEALDRLSRLNFRFKGKIIEAATTAVLVDGEVKHLEIDFLRAIGASLDCPIPPLQVGAV